MKDKVVHLRLVPQAVSRFLVRWHDDDCGWKQVIVEAENREGAYSLIEELTGRGDLQVLKAA